jgi:peptidoglycan/xylan/chitin deacetylase (PgdA/CDA1 family)
MSSTIPGRNSGFVQSGPNTDMRSFVAASVMLASLACAGAAAAAECPPGAMGVSRTIVVDPAEHQLLGSQQYRESLPLRDKEVVLTFDDGPLPPYTNRILDTLASECVKATFFLVGRMVRGYPSIVRRIYNDGHTIANHSQNHPFTFHKMTVEQASTEIEDGFESLRSVLGNPKAVSPFFRIPGLLRQPAVEQYLSSRNYMTWSVDFLADDWTRISASEVAKRAISRMEAHRKGILLLHDIQPATALAFPEILSELKARGYKIVHVVPATPDRPKTVTAPEQWAARGAAPEPKVWPRVVSVNRDALSNAEPKLAVPSAASLGLSSPLAPVTSIAMVPNLERAQVRDGEVPLPPVLLWPRRTFVAPADTQVLPAPAAQTMRYTRVFQMPGTEKRRTAAAGTQPAKPKAPNTPAAAQPSTPTRHVTAVRPPLALNLLPAFMR